MKSGWLLTVSAMIVLVVSAPAHAVVLRHVPKTGEVHHYSVAATGVFAMKIGALDQTSRTETGADLRFEHKALSESDGIVRLQTDLLGGDTTTRRDDQVTSAKAPTGKFVVMVDRLGHLTKVQKVVVNGNDLTGEMGPWTELLSKWSQCCGFPDRDVKVGDTWTGTFTGSIPPGGLKTKVAIKSQLLDLAEYMGRRCARIRTTFDGPLESGAESLGPFGNVEATTGRVQGDLIWQYDWENSVLVAGEGSGSMEESRLLEGILGPGMPDRTVVSTKEQVKLRIALDQ